MPVPAVALLWLLQLLAAPVSTVCPGQCHCNRTSLTVSCERGRLEHFPIQLNPRVERLSLAGNHISRLQGSIDHYTGLVALNLSSNAVDQLEALTFEHQQRLRELDLGHNLLELLPRGALAGLLRLERLGLADNRLARLEEGAFREAAGLRRLDLSGNRLESLGSALSGLPRLEVLTLCGNRLARVGGAELRALAAVRELSLCDNGMETLDGLQHLSGLRRLDLSGNRLTVLSGLSGLTELRRLDLSGNRLTALAGAAPAALHWLDLSGNRLRRLSAADLSGLRRLQELRLCDTAELRAVAGGALSGCPELHTLHLCNNSRLERLPADLLVPSLRWVSLRDCRLSAVPEPAAAANLTWLDARGNRLSCNCSQRWLHAAVAAGRAPDVLCAGPGSLRGRRLSLLEAAELWCPPRLAPLALALGLPLLVLALAGGAFCALCRRRRRHKTATAGGCVAALAHPRGGKVAAPDGADRQRLRWPRYWPYEETSARCGRQDAATKLYTGHSEPSPELSSPEPGPELKLVLSADRTAGYSSDDLYAASFSSADRGAPLRPPPDPLLTLRSTDGRYGAATRPRRLSTALADTHHSYGHSAWSRDPWRPASVTGADLTGPRGPRVRRLEFPTQPRRSARRAGEGRHGDRRGDRPPADCQFTQQTGDGVRYIPVNMY